MSEVLPSMEELLSRVEAKGRADREKEVIHYLVHNGYIKYGFNEEYLAEQLKEQKNGQDQC